MTNGLVVMTPTSISYSGTSASVNADGSVGFSAVTSLSLNGVFTGDYDNYMIAVRHSNSANNIDTSFRLRASGVDNSTASSYTRQLLALDNTNKTSLRLSENAAFMMPTDIVWRNGTTVFLFGPYLAQPTVGRSLNVRSLTDVYLIDVVWTHNQSVAYDGFTVGPTSGNWSGLFTVFGFNQ